MIDISTLYAIHQQATEALLDFRIAEGLRGLSVLMQECEDQQLARETEAATQDYERMMDFLAQGGQDDKHSEVQDSLVRHLLRTLDATVRQIRIQKAEDLYSKAFVRLRNNFGSELADALRRQWNNQQGMTERYETQDLLFDLLWTMPMWDSHQTAEWFEFLSRLDELTRQHLEGGIILSLWEYFDEEKLTLLRLLGESEEPAVRTRAVTAYLLLTLKYEKRLALYPEAELDTKDKELARIAQAVQRELILMQESPRVNKAINHELASLNFREIGNEAFQNSLKEAMQKYGKFLMLGIDLDLNKVSLLHSSRFLRSISHWWAPFDESRPTVQEVFIRQNGEYAEGLRNLFSRSTECSVNRYAICEAIQQHVDLASLDQQMLRFMQQRDEEDDDDDDDKPKKPEETKFTPVQNERRLIRGFVQNLYRFFNHSPLSNEVSNAFELNLLLSDNPLLRPIFNPQQLTQTAHLLIHFQQSKPAFHLLQEVAETEGASAELLRAIAQCKQSEGDLPKAAQYFSQADLLQEDDPWTLCQLEICYANMKRYDRLWEILQRLDRIQPEDESITRRMAACLIMQERHAEALNYLYKVELSEHIDPSVITQIALSSAHVKRFENAEKYIQKRLDMEQPLLKEERLKFGAIYFAQGRWNEALTYFQQSDLAAYDEFRPNLHLLGISTHDVQLMHDIIERSR